MNEAYLKLAIAALLPVVVTLCLYLLENRTPYGQLSRKLRQCAAGLVFGVLAILGTEWGIPLNGAQVNCRDAAVLVAGLLFGPSAGVIAGIIGGAERWIAVSWGVGSFTRVACSIATIFAGFYAAALRKYMFEDRKPGWLISLAIGVVMEVFHMTLIFLTNMASPIQAMEAVKACALPMLVANGLSVMFSAIVMTLAAKELKWVKKETVRISQTIQYWMLLAVALAFLATSYFVFKLQDTIATTQMDSQLALAVDEIAADIHDASDQNLLSLTHKVAAALDFNDLETLAQQFDVTEISRIDQNGIIIQSTEDRFVGFNMSFGKQSSEFLCLLNDSEEYVQKYGPIAYDATVMRKYAGVKTENGFVQVGYDAEHFQKDIDGSVVGLTKNRHVGNTGYVLILNKNLDIVSMPEGLAYEELQHDLAVIQQRKESVTFQETINGEPAFFQYETAEGYYIVSVLPAAEALQLRNIALYVNTFLEIIVFAILFSLIYVLIRKVVVNRIKSVNDSLSRITDGDLGVVVNVRSNEEFVTLSDDINSTVDTLKRYIDEASARLDKELEMAKNIQSSALPSTFPAFPKRKEFDIYASMDPAKEVGGDFYDFYITHTEMLHFLVADVSGKGIPAALFMMRAKTELKSLTEADLQLCDIFTHGNEALCEGNDAGMFVTAWQGSLDLENGMLHFTNAGHNPPLVRRENGEFSYLKTRAGFVLAGMEGVRYQTQQLQLLPGDEIFLYTDGVTEATDATNQLYGEERLLQAINSRKFETMQELCKYVRDDVDRFVGDAPQFDDITMLALHYYGKPMIPSIHFENAVTMDLLAVTEFAESKLTQLGCPRKSIIELNIAIDEIFSNIVKYAYRGVPGPVTVEYIERENPHAVAIRFSDEGVAYNPLTKEDPDITLPIEERTVGGLGIFLIKRLMDDLKYEYQDENNILTIVKYLPQ